MPPGRWATTKTGDFYSLKIAARDRGYTYSRVMAVALNVQSGTLKLFPNPIKETFFVQISSSKAQKATIKITDIQVKLLQMQLVQLQVDNTNTSINTETLARDSYLLLIMG